MTAREAPRFPFVAVQVGDATADETAAWLMDLGAEGVEVRDSSTTPPGPAPGQTLLQATFATEEGARQAQAALEGAGIAATVDVMVGDAWRDAYKEHFKPFELAGGLIVAPPWVERPRGDVLVLDPGRAFGTGLHATTQLAAAQLERHRDAYRGGVVLDVGAGSGILALAALIFGARAAICIDNDPDALAVARENAIRNGFAERVMLGEDLSAVQGTFPAAVANIQTAVLLPLAHELAARTAPGALVVLSGVLEHERDEILQGYESLFDLVSSETRDGWIAIALRRRG